MLLIFIIGYIFDRIYENSMQYHIVCERDVFGEVLYFQIYSYVMFKSFRTHNAVKYLIHRIQLHQETITLQTLNVSRIFLFVHCQYSVYTRKMLFTFLSSYYKKNGSYSCIQPEGLFPLLTSLNFAKESFMKPSPTLFKGERRCVGKSLKWNRFQNDESEFLNFWKSSFRSQDIFIQNFGQT